MYLSNSERNTMSIQTAMVDNGSDDGVIIRDLKRPDDRNEFKSEVVKYLKLFYSRYEAIPTGQQIQIPVRYEETFFNRTYVNASNHNLVLKCFTSTSDFVADKVYFDELNKMTPEDAEQALVQFAESFIQTLVDQITSPGEGLEDFSNLIG